MVACALPDGVGDEHYWPLMILLSEEMSIRQTAAFMGYLYRDDEQYPSGRMYNDVLKVLSHIRPNPSNLHDVRTRLLACGYAEWLEKEDYGGPPD